MKRAGWVLAAAVAAYGVYLVAGRSKAPEDVPVDAAKPGEVVIAPAPAYANSALHVQQVGRRPGNASPVVSCRWFVNGAEATTATGPALAPGQFKKGDEIEAEVVLAGGGAPVRTASIRIQNTRPRVVSAAANLRTEPSAAIGIDASVVDADDDPIAYTYQWYKNGREMPGETGATVGVTRFQMGDVVTAMVTAHDGVESSSPQKSDPIKIGSNAPDITSNPPTSLEPGRRFVYQVTTSAPEPGALRYELIDAPAGMTMDDNGLIEWTVPEPTEDAIDYAVAVRVSDPTGGEAVQRFRVSTAVQRSSATE
jgi:hypothetical protein